MPLPQKELTKTTREIFDQQEDRLGQEIKPEFPEIRTLLISMLI